MEKIKFGYGFKPFWFWNGDMEDGEIVRQIEEMHSQGVDGFFIHPRQGLTVPYLSEKWFEKVGVAIEAAKRLGVEVWLYDEYTYPSGAAGGRVMIERPELAARLLEIYTHDVKGGPVSIDYKWGVLLDACAVPLKNGQLNWAGRIPLADNMGMIYPDYAYQDSGLTNYNKKRFFSEGTDWNLTWQAPEGEWRIFVSIEHLLQGFKYFDTFIDPVNPEAVRLFINHTHEKYKKHFGHEFGKTVKGIFADETMPWNYESQLPWSQVLPDIFKKEKGYDLVELLPALVDDIGDMAANIRRDYYEVVTNAFIENFDGQISRWCEENNLLYTGEKPILTIGQLKYSHVPGVDAGHHKAGDLLPIGGVDRAWYRAMPKVAASAAHFYHDGRAMVEAFHSLGWDVTMQDLKYNIDVFSICGVNVVVPHAYFYSTDGMRKHDAPPSCFFQLPQWKYTGLLSKHMRDTWAFLQGRRIAEILVLDNAMGFYTMSRKDRNKKDRYRGAMGLLHEKLMVNGLDFYVIDRELLNTSKVADRQIFVNSEGFRVLVVPPMDYMDAATQDFITTCDLRGVKIVHVIGAKGEIDVDEAVAEAKAYIVPAYAFDDTKILSCAYETPNGHHILALNTVATPVEARIKDSVVKFASFESKFIRVVGDDVAEIGRDGLETPTPMPLPIEATWDMAIQSPNALPFREWSLSLPDGQQAVVGCKPLINQFMESGLKLAPSYVKNFGTQPKISFPPMTVCYSAAFVVDHIASAVLHIEEDGILGNYTIEVNGKPVCGNGDIAPLLQLGNNTIQVTVEATKSWHGVVNPVYIKGHFGVEVDTGGSAGTIVKLPDTGTPLGYVESKLPYYAGDVTYTAVLDFAATALTLPDNMGLAASLIVDGQDLGQQAFSPYQWCLPANLQTGGSNQVALTISTGLSAYFEGETVDPITHEIRKV